MRLIPHGSQSNVKALVLLAIAVGLFAAPASAQESSGPRSIAERLSSLRFSWNRKADDEQKPEAQSREAGGSGSRTREGSIGQAPRPRSNDAASSRQSNSSKLPSIDPRDLIPREYLESQRSESGASNSRGMPPRTTRRGVQGVGSARARIMRDLRQRSNPTQRTAAPTTVAETPAASGRSDSPQTNPGRQTAQAPPSPKAERPAPTPLARRAPARAGSVLSPEPPTATRPSPTESERVEMSASQLREELLRPSFEAKPSRQSAAATAAKRELSKSLAGEIARKIASEPVATAPKPSPMEKQAADLEQIAEAIASSTPAETEPSSEEQEADPVNSLEAFAAGLAAGNESGRRYATSEAIPETPTDTTPTEITAAVRTRSPAEPETETKPMVIEARPAPARTVVTTPAPKQSMPSIDAPRVKTIVDNTAVLRFGGVTDERKVETPRAPQFAQPEPRRKVVDAVVAPLAASEAELLMSKKMPLIVSRVDGPRRIVIGRKAEYKVVLANRGEASADDLVARVKAPAWAKVISTDASKGHVVPGRAGGAGQEIEWRLDEFDSKSVAQLTLALVAQEGKPIELGVDWRHAPVGARTVVEVQEPKIELSVSGPEDVTFGVPQRYQLSLSNPGTGTAEDVVLHLLPPGSRPDEASTHSIGDLGAGVSKTIEIELTAREAGELSILSRATAAGGLESVAEKRLLCRKAELDVDWRGPERQYAGAPTNYYFRVRNPGTADANDVTFVVDLPAGFRLDATSPGQKYDPAKRRLAWTIGSLRPGDDKYLQIRGAASSAGDNRFKFAAATADRLVGDSSAATTRVVAVADLRLDVSDPKGPLPVATDVEYEVRVKNRGASAATGVEIVAMFSDGIEPHDVQGGSYSVSDGRVAIDSIGTLDAGDERVIVIRARATRPGTHVFRAEVQCRDLEIKLAEEEMTRFYAEESIEAASPRSAGAMDDFVYPRR